jgi:hypothetical protein
VPDKDHISVTVHEELEFIRAAFDARASGYAFKSRMHTDLKAAINAVQAGRVQTRSWKSGTFASSPAAPWGIYLLMLAIEAAIPFGGSRTPQARLRFLTIAAQ